MAKKSVHVAVERTKGETVVPANTLKLIEAIGASRASRMLGVSTTTLFKARKNNVVSRVIEEASEGKLKALSEVLQGQPAKPAPEAHPARQASPGTVLFLMEVSPDKRAIVERFAEALDARIMVS